MCDFFDMISSLFGGKSSKSIAFKDRQLKVLKKIGSGGYSSILLVRDPLSDNQYALKQMMVGDKKAKIRAQIELDMYVKWKDHPNMIQMYDYDIKALNDDAEQYLFLLDYYPRGSLYDYIQSLKEKNEYMGENELCKIFLSILNGVKALHTSDPPLVHRDIKPQNILLGDNDNAILIDFASVSEARAINVNELRHSQKLEFQEDAWETSTPSYRPPELFDLGGIFSDEVIDERVDIWSLGCMLYAMAYHKNPFDDAVIKGGDLKLAVVNGKIDIPGNSKYSDTINNLIKMMITKSNERPFINDVINIVESNLSN